MDIRAASFSGHESFPFRHTWLTKGVSACALDPSTFRSDEAMVSLGVGKNMVQAIRHWCLATQMIEEDPQQRNNRGRFLRPTAIGQRLFLTDGGWDPYLENVATLWLIHWLLVTNSERATTWCFAFNYWHQPDFTRRTLEHAITDWATKLRSVRFTTGTLRRDIDVFIRTYVGSQQLPNVAIEDTLECPLVELGLIYEQELHDTYSFLRGPKDTLPDAILLFALQDYARRHPSQQSFTFDELAYGPFGPGRVFKLDEFSLAERLDGLSELTNGAWRFTETAGYEQILMAHDMNAFQILDDYYHGRRNPVSGA